MPLFAYVCDTCDDRIDVAHDRHISAPPCPTCGAGLRKDYSTAQFTPSSMPSRRNTIPPRRADPAWERGIVTVKRGDMRAPLIKPDGTTVGVKDYAEHRHQYEAYRRELATRPAPTTA